MSTETSWEVPGGFTNTGLCINGDGNLAVGNWPASRIQFCNVFGDDLGSLLLQDMPLNTLQGVAWDSLRGNYWVSKYSSSTQGEIRRYSTDGTLLATYPATESQIGPNGCVYEATTDRLLVLYSNARIYEYDCATGALLNNIPLTPSPGGQTDGIGFDPDDQNFVWVSVDSAAPGKVVKVNRNTGALISEFPLLGGGSPEHIAFIDGILHICCDRLFHEGVQNGNRVHRYTLQGVPSLVPPRPAAARPEPIVLPRSPVTSAWVQDDPLITPDTVATAGWPSIWGM